MRPLSPTEAINPAIARTRAVLFQPFRLGRSWKLAFCAYLALCGSVFNPFPLFYLAIPTPAGSGATFRYLLWIGSIGGTALMLAVYYLGSRMQFVLFDYTLAPSPFIAPLWRRHGAHTWRWIGLKLAITIPLGVILFLPLYPLIRRLITLLPALARPGQPPDLSVLTAILPVYLVLLAAVSLLFLVGSILSDFILPPLALEDVSVAESLRRFGALCQQEPLSLLGYVALRILLALAGFILQYAATLITMLLLGLVLGAIAVAGWFALHTFVPRTLLVAGGLVLYLVSVVCFIYIQLLTFGALIIFLRAYSLFFLGGRYPSLGGRLEPLSPHPPPPPLSSTLAAPPPPSPIPG